MRSAATIVMLLASVLAALGCGKSDPERSVTRAEALAFAARVDLRAGDVSGMSPAGAERDLASLPRVGCASATPAVAPIVDRLSPRFLGRVGEVDSYVAVYRTAALAASQREVDPARVRECAVRALARTAFRCNVSESSTGSLPRSADAFALRVLCIRLHPAPGEPGQFVEDSASFRVGAAVVGLVAIGRGAPVALATERALLATMYSRVRGHPL